VQRHFATKDDLWRGAVDASTTSFPTADDLDPQDPMGDGIAVLLRKASVRPGLMTAILCDRAPGHAERFAYISDRLSARHEALRSMIADLQNAGEFRDFDASALLILLNVGIGSIASAPAAARDIYGFDLEDAVERDRLAVALTDILRSGLREP